VKPRSKASSRPQASAKRSSGSASSGGRELAALLVGEIPGIGTREKFGNLSFSVGGKVFGFTRGGEAVVLKLPAARVMQLMEERAAKRLVMGKRVMKQWVVIEQGGPGWRGELKLVREAVEFVGGL
jgi:hypothetical protein